VGESEVFEPTSSTSVQLELEHPFLASATFRSRIMMDRAFVYGASGAQPGVRLKYVCNNLGCKARKDSNFCYSEARASKVEVTVSNPFDSAKFLKKVVDKLLDDHKECLPPKEALMKECTEDERPLMMRVRCCRFVPRLVLRSSDPLCSCRCKRPRIAR
jgi:hypothetical protein